MTDEALAKSTVDQLPSLQRVTLVRFVMDLSELDSGCGSEKPRRDGEDEGEGMEETRFKCWRYLSVTGG